MYGETHLSCLTHASSDWSTVADAARHCGNVSCKQVKYIHRWLSFEMSVEGNSAAQV